ncbi:uncharacterized protein CLUP02_01828 [Colletotrichum lupini]|uniref:Uncharacterized protein n=1 Tax=Colletotrichum lupini TaxID=145971 RepID=A0A9Q8SDU8_9PEZI|nr:uncharacterized protein CLUP02_01828 [Colletotrichum lupini]UQC75175.1 hypothetical protein CLUP02_01828 [Colletotrichum lupini]
MPRSGAYRLTAVGEAGAGNPLSALEWGRYYYGASATTGLLPTSTLINMTFSRPYSTKEDNGLCISSLRVPVYPCPFRQSVAPKDLGMVIGGPDCCSVVLSKSCRGNGRERCSNLRLRVRFVPSLDGFERESPAAWRIPVLEPIEMAVVAEHITPGIPARRRSQPDDFFPGNLDSFVFGITPCFWRTPYFGQDLQTDFLPILVKLVFEQFYDFHHNLLASSSSIFPVQQDHLRASGNTWPGSHRNREATNVLGDPSADNFLRTRQFGRLSQIANHGCLEQDTVRQQTRRLATSCKPRAEASCLRHVASSGTWKRPPFLNTSFSSPPHRRLDLIHSRQGRFMRHINESRLIALDSAYIQSEPPLPIPLKSHSPNARLPKLAGLQIEELEVKSSTLDGLWFCASVSYLADLAGRTDFVIASYDQLGLDRPWQCSSFVADNLQCERSSKLLDITKPLGKHSVLTLIAPEGLSIPRCMSCNSSEPQRLNSDFTVFSGTPAHCLRTFNQPVGPIVCLGIESFGNLAPLPETCSLDSNGTPSLNVTAHTAALPSSAMQGSEVYYVSFKPRIWKAMVRALCTLAVFKPAKLDPEEPAHFTHQRSDSEPHEQLAT